MPKFAMPGLRAIAACAAAALLAGCGESGEEEREEAADRAPSAAQEAAEESVQETAPPAPDAGATAGLAETLTIPEPGGEGWAEAQTAYLEAFAEQDGVQATESGVYYEVLRAGEGASPEPGANVAVHYEGRLIDGKVFDSSYERGEPASFATNQVIQGWQDVLPRMKEGARWRVAIPAELAYGSREMGDGLIPSDSALVFTIDLLEVAG